MGQKRLAGANQIGIDGYALGQGAMGGGTKRKAFVEGELAAADYILTQLEVATHLNIIISLV